jgi:hypothetical protein
MDRLTREEVQRLIEDERKKAPEELNPEELKAILEKRGYNVLEPPRSWEEVEKMIREAEKRGYEMAQNDKRIEAVKAIIERAVDSITSMFAPAIRQYWEAVMASRASAPTSATGDSVASTTSNTQQSSQTASDSSS